MIDEIIKELKAISEKLDVQITSASRGLRLGDQDRCEFARTKIQEAITRLLEIT